MVAGWSSGCSVSASLRGIPWPLFRTPLGIYLWDFQEIVCWIRPNKFGCVFWEPCCQWSVIVGIWLKFMRRETVTLVRTISYLYRSLIYLQDWRTRRLFFDVHIKQRNVFLNNRDATTIIETMKAQTWWVAWAVLRSYYIRNQCYYDKIEIWLPLCVFFSMNLVTDNEHIPISHCQEGETKTSIIRNKNKRGYWRYINLAFL